MEKARGEEEEENNTLTQTSKQRWHYEKQVQCIDQWRRGLVQTHTSLCSSLLLPLLCLCILNHFNSIIKTHHPSHFLPFSFHLSSTSTIHSYLHLLPSHTLWDFTENEWWYQGCITKKPFFRLMACLRRKKHCLQPQQRVSLSIPKFIAR